MYESSACLITPLSILFDILSDSGVKTVHMLFDSKHAIEKNSTQISKNVSCDCSFKGLKTRKEPGAPG